MEEPGHMERKDSKTRQLSLYTILRFFHAPKTFKQLAFETGMSLSGLNWYKSEVIARGWIREYDSIRSGGTSRSTRYVITESGKAYMEKLQEELTVSGRRKRRSPVRYIGDPDWEKIEILIDSGLSLAQASRRMKLRPEVVWKKFQKYSKSSRRDLLVKLKQEGKISSDVEELMSRSPKHRYRTIPWRDVEILLSQGRSLLSISREFGIGYGAFRARFERYSKSGERMRVIDELMSSGLLERIPDPSLARNENLRKGPGKRRVISAVDSSARGN